MRKSTTSTVAILTTSCLATLTAAIPAHADGPTVDNGHPVTHLDFYVLGDGSHQWCATGATKRLNPIAPTWTVTLSGARSTGSRIAPPPYLASGPRLSETCFTIPKLGASHGNVTVTITYVGIGGDLPLTGVANSTWVNAQNHFLEWHTT